MSTSTVYGSMTLAQMKQISAEHEGTFFAPHLLRHYNTRVCASTIRQSRRNPHIWYFVTSATRPGYGTDRYYTIRAFDDRWGRVDTIGDLHDVLTLRRAQYWIARIIND